MCGRSGGRGRRSREQIATHPKGGGGKEVGKAQCTCPPLQHSRWCGSVDKWDRTDGDKEEERSKGGKVRLGAQIKNQ